LKIVNFRRKEDNAVAEIIGYILVFALVVVTVTSFIVVYVPASSNSNLYNYESNSLSTITSIQTHLSNSAFMNSSLYSQSVPMGVKGSFFTANTPTTIGLQADTPNYSMSYGISLNIQVEGHQNKISSSVNKVAGSIQVGSSPDGIVYDSTNGLLYVINYYSNIGEGSISILTGATGTSIGTIQLNAHPYSIAYDSSTQELLLTLYTSSGSGELMAISAVTNQVTQTLLGNGYIFYDIAYDQSTGAALVSFYDGVTGSIGINVYNASSLIRIDGPLNYAISPGTIPSALTYDPANGLIYVAGGEHIWTLNGVTYQIVSYYQLTSPWNMVFDSANGMVYSTANYVSGSGYYALIPLNDGFHTTYVYNSTTSNLVQTLNVGYCPDAILFDPANRYIYVSSYSGTVSIFDGANISNTPLIATLNIGQGVGAGFNSITYDTATGNVYLTNIQTDTVSIIEGNTNLSHGWKIKGSKLGLNCEFNASGSLSLGASNGFSNSDQISMQDGSVINIQSGQPPIAQTILPFEFNLTSGYLGLNMNMVNFAGSSNVTISSASAITFNAQSLQYDSMTVTSGTTLSLTGPNNQSVTADILSIHLYNFTYTFRSQNIEQWNDVFYHQYVNSSASDQYISSLASWNFPTIPITARISGDSVTFATTNTIVVYSFLINYASYAVSLSS
jgi:DNA-binding beta-propeller fold protein YncE